MPAAAISVTVLFAIRLLLISTALFPLATYGVNAAGTSEIQVKGPLHPLTHHHYSHEHCTTSDAGQKLFQGENGQDEIRLPTKVPNMGVTFRLNQHVRVSKLGPGDDHNAPARVATIAEIATAADQVDDGTHTVLDLKDKKWKLITVAWVKHVLENTTTGQLSIHYDDLLNTIGHTLLKKEIHTMRPFHQLDHHTSALEEKEIRIPADGGMRTFKVGQKVNVDYLDAAGNWETNYVASIREILPVSAANDEHTVKDAKDHSLKQIWVWWVEDPEDEGAEIRYNLGKDPPHLLRADEAATMRPWDGKFT